MHTLILILTGLLASQTLTCNPGLPTQPDLPRIILSSKEKGFQEKQTGKPFYPWGFNYDHDEKGRLIEDYWDQEWDKVTRDFATMKKLGGNVVRIHFQVGAFMESAEQVKPAALKKLKDLTRLANQTALYLNLTGLACYHKKDVPAWYDQLDEKGRWQCHANFWKGIAQAVKDDTAVFCLDLMNEPVVPGGKRKPGEWLGPSFGDKTFVQFITLDQANRPRETIAKAWIDFLVPKIRAVAPEILITVGLVDWSLDRPGLTSGFVPRKTCESLDFLSTHIYPEKGKIPLALETLKGFDIGKPVIIEETFPLKCDFREMATFLKSGRPNMNGVISFYWGKPPEELKKSQSIADAITAQWLEEFPKWKP